VLAFVMRVRPVPFSASVIGLTAAYLAIATLAFLNFQVLFPVVRTLLMLSFAVTFSLGHRYIVEERDKTFLRRTFEAYFPPKGVKRITANPRLIVEAMIDIVFRYEGTVDKVIGDGLMVFCGDPEPQPDHATRCVRMAIEVKGLDEPVEVYEVIDPALERP